MYKKAFELSYKNKKVEIEIQDFVGDVRNINGTEDLFSLSYISDSKDKGQSILVTEADINFYADDYFNIDELKTVGETDIKVKYYEDDSLLWSGFVIPDFFSTSVDITPVVSMVATDRVGTLKEISNNAESNIPIQILASCLKQTGQDLPINLIADNNHFETPIQLERIEEIASYDVIRTFMVLFNCKVVLFKNAWWIINKKLLESGFVNYKSYNSNGVGGSVTPFAQPILDIDLVDRDGQREIKPTASEISLFLEFGGSKKYPSNRDFNEWSSNKLNNWTAYNGFIQNKNSKIPLSYDSNYSLIYGQDTNINSLLSRNPFFSTLTNNNYINSPHIRSEEVPMQFIKGISEVNFKIDFSSINDDRFAIYAVLLIKIPNRNPLYHDYVAIGHDGNIVKAGTTNIDLTNVAVMRIQPAFDENQDRLTAIRTTIESKFKISASDDLDLARSSNAKIQIILFGTEYNDGANTSLIDVVLHSSEISFNDFETTGKGLIFKIKQGGDKFSKSRDPETILFSDKINQGVNGHFYNYKYDDTSIVDLPSEFALSSVRERADMFSKARDYYSLDGDFIVNPLAKYVCGSKSFVLVGGENRREDAGIVIEEIVSNTLNRTDFIYTYFDDGKDKVKTIGTGSGGSSSGGGGGSSPSTPQLIKVDEEGNYYSEQPFYSLGGLSAFGFSEVGDGNGGGGIINVIDNLTSTSKTDPLSANMGRYLKTLIDNIEVGEGGQVIVDWDAITGKPTTFNPSAHTHIIGDVTGLQGALDDKASLSQLDDKEDKFTKNTAFNKNFGTELNDVARGNHTHTFASLTSKPTTLSGYGITDAYTKTNVDTLLSGKENAFTKNSAFNKDFGTTAGTVTQGNDGRLSDARTPLAHSHPISDVTDLQTTLADKLETTVFNTHNNDNVRHITSAERTKWNGVVTDFGNLEIGGRNLLLDSNVDYRGEGYTGNHKVYSLSELIDDDETVTVTLKIDYEGDASFHLRSQAPQTPIPNGGLVKISKGLYRKTFSWANVKENQNQLGFWKSGTGETWDLVYVKLEKGNKATDWTPAPEDQVSDWLITDINSFSFIKNKPTMLSQFIDNIGVAQHRIDFDAFKTTFDTMFRKTPTNEIEAKLSLYTLGGLSAYGFSDEGSSGGGGGIVNILSSWGNYTSDKSGWALGAGLGKGLYDNKADKTDPRFTDARTPLAHSHIISDVTGLQEALNAKTNQTFSDGLNQRLTSVEGGSATTVNTSGSGNAITSISKSGNIITAKKDLTFALPTDITNAIDGLEIGGRNLVLESDTPVSTSAYLVAEYFITEDFIGGETYTLSLKGTKLASQNFALFQNAAVNSIGHLVHKGNDIYQLTFPSLATTAGNERRIRIYQPNSTTAGLATIDWIKIEKGSIPTDWSPAPEDQVSDWSTTDVDSFSFIKNKPTKLSQFSNVETAFINKTQADGWYASLTNFNSHVNNKENPHLVTTAQIGAVDLTTNQNVGGVKSFTEGLVLHKNTQDFNALLIKTDSITGDVTSKIQFTNFYDTARIVAIANPSTTWAGILRLQTKKNTAADEWNEGITIDRVGNVGIGTTSPSEKLDVIGNIKASGTLTALGGNSSNWNKVYGDFNEMFRKVGTSIEAKLPLYSLGGLSAYGFSEEGSETGGGIVNILPSWANYTTDKSGWALSAGLGKGLYDNKADKTDPRFTDARTPLAHTHPISDITGLQGALNSKTNQTFSDGLNTRLTSIEGGSATTVNVSGAGDLLASVSKVGNNINFIKGNQSWGNLTGKPSTFAPSAHTHPISDITNLQTTLADKLETTVFNTHNNDNVRHITGAERTKWDGVVTDFDGLEIGGRNLFQKGRLVVNYMYISATTGLVSSGTAENKNTIYIHEVKEGDKYSISRINNPLDAKGRCVVGFTKEFPTNGVQTYNFINKNDEEDIRIENITVPKDCKYLAVYISRLRDEDEIYTDKWKLEKGNKATDWTPAPEDMVDRYSNQTIGGVKSFTSNAKFTTIEASGTLKSKDIEVDTNWKVLKSGNELEFRYNNVKKATLTPNGDLIVTGGMTAYQ